ncbi:MAG: hypothetical protein MR299_00330 [Bacteroidales bacterium]|nr:hypothetical protein [Bacteroidales bacterium]
MKKYFSLMALLLCFAGQAWADKIEASTTDPSNGKPEHLYTMVSGNGYYANGYTAPTQTDENKALFAFYSAGISDTYYIYCYTSKKWLSYTKAASYSDGTKGFLRLTDSKTDGAYFKCNNYSGDYYEIALYNTTSVATKYLNWFQGVNDSANPLDGTTTLGYWKDNGANDGGSRWQFAEADLQTHTYTIVAPAGTTVTVNGTAYTNGQTVTSEGRLQKSAVSATAQEGKFVIISINDVTKTITVAYATIPEQPATTAYTNAVLYPAQQEAVGEAKVATTADTYTLYNNVLAASFVKANNSLYFAGSNAMNLLPGTEIFTVAFGSGDNVPASAMTLNSVEMQTLTGESTAVGGAEHYNGHALVANYTYTYKGATVNIVWKAVLRDGSHYLRTEMELTGVNDVDMYNVIPLIYNVDTNAAGSTPATLGNTRGAVLMSNKIFAGLESPVAYNTVGEATGTEDNYTLATTLDPISLTATSWSTVASASLPNRVIEATGANYPNVLAYVKDGVTLAANQKVEITVAYTSGNHRLNFGGADLLDNANDVAASDYHSGFSGNDNSNNTFVFTAPYAGTFKIRVFVEKATEEVDANSTMTVKIYTPKEGAAITADVVGIQGLWSRNTTLAAGETWKISGVVGLIAQDGTQDNSNIHKTQKRRSFLAYSERERAVPWRANPCYISWYELNIDRNNAANPTNNMNANQVLDVLNHWKSDFYDVYGVGPSSFVIDDGWDNYGTWTFHAGFPNEMRDIAALAAQMGAGVGAWLGPVGGYGTSGNYRRQYWTNKGQKMELSNPEYYATFKAAAKNLTQNNGDFRFFKFDGISAQFSAVGPDPGDTGNENAEGIIRLERFVREECRRDIFFNTTVGTWASPFWYHYTDATWRQEGDYGTIGNNSIDRENWITYRDRLVYQNYVTNSPICPINTLMTHGFILSTHGQVSKNMDYEPARRELRCAFVCGSGMVELYNDYERMNSINGGALWGDLAECIKWQKKNADVLPDAHWVGGNPWDGSKANVYGWASWNGTKATLALRNGSNSSQTYTFTLRDALNIPANVNGAMYFVKSFSVQDALPGFAEGQAISYDTQLTVTLPGSSLFAFDGSLSEVEAPSDTFTFTASDPENGSRLESLSTVTLTFPAEVGLVSETALEVKDASNTTVTTAAFAKSETDGTKVIVTLTDEIATNGTYRIAVPEKFIFDSNVDTSAEDKGVSNGATYNPAFNLSYTIKVAEDYPVNFDKDASATRTDRYINSITLTETGQTAQSVSLSSRKPYIDLTEDENAHFTCTAGSTLTTTFNWTGSWMHGYVYIDTDNDKHFSFTEGSTTQTDTEVYAFSFYSGNFNDDQSGYNSAGTRITGNDRAVVNPPSFTAPGTNGTYRIRFKIDWNSIDPGGQLASDGTATGANGIIANGGQIVDALLTITGGAETGINSLNTESKTKDVMYDLSGRRLNAAPAQGVFILNGKTVIR